MSTNSVDTKNSSANEKVATKRVGRWYFGGLASSMAAACTHPLDLIKVHLITQQKAEMGLIKMGVRVVRNDGVLALYNGLSASLLRQLTYSTTRFALYETYKTSWRPKWFVDKYGSTMPFYEKAATAAFSGFLGGIFGNPADMINVRMQNDVKLPPELRRNYKHAIDGMIRVWRQEGPTALANGITMTSTRAAFMTLGQLAFYDTFKEAMIASGFFQDNTFTHFASSFGAAGAATCITQPFDVMKTRMMNAKPGTYSNLASCGMDILVSGPLGFFKGLVPAFIRLGPHTVLTFIFFEKIKENFGIVVKVSPSS